MPPLVIANVQGGYLSCDRPSPLAKDRCRNWEEWTIVPLKIIKEGVYEVALQTRNGDYLSAVPTGVLEYQPKIGEWEKFRAEVVGVMRRGVVAFRTHHGTYINVCGSNIPLASGFIFHHVRNKDGPEQLQVQFVITRPAWVQQHTLVLNGKLTLITKGLTSLSEMFGGRQREPVDSDLEFNWQNAAMSGAEDMSTMVAILTEAGNWDPAANHRNSFPHLGGDALVSVLSK